MCRLARQFFHLPGRPGHNRDRREMEGTTPSLILRWPITRLYEELQPNCKCAACEGPPVNHTRLSPEVASERADQQAASRLPNPVGDHASAMRTNVLRASRLSDRLIHAGQLHRFVR